MKQTVIKYCMLLVITMLTSFTEAKEVFMAFSLEIPPYIFEKHDKGIEIDIISAALAYKGHALKPLYFPLGRVPIAFKSNLVDAAMGDMGINLETSGGFYADPAVIYNNVFFTLKSKKISIEKPSDLDLLRVVSFQGAEKRYPKWLKKVKEEKRFYGISDQLTQVKLLHFDRYDVVLSDRYIFKYFIKQLMLMNVIEMHDVDEHEFTTVYPDDYRPVFRSEKIRDDFNQGLRKMKETGQFQKIYDFYLTN